VTFLAYQVDNVTIRFLNEVLLLVKGLSDLRFLRLKSLIDFGLPLGFDCNPSIPKAVKSFCHLLIVESKDILNFK
jgi:hypothetical protein